MKKPTQRSIGSLVILLALISIIHVTKAQTHDMEVEGDAHVHGDLIVDGNFDVESINVSQITGILGDGYSAVFPDVLDNSVEIEVVNIAFEEKVVMVSSIGFEMDYSFTPITNCNTVEEGFTMEFPIVFETDNTNDVAALEDWFGGTAPMVRGVSIIIRELGGAETARWNCLEYEPGSMESGSDGRTRFTLINAETPDNVLRLEYNQDFGDVLSFDPTTDKLVEISSVMTGSAFAPAVQIDYINRIITLEFGYNEGYRILDWVEASTAGLETPKSGSVIMTADGTLAGETSRENFYEMVPIKYEHIYGFGLNTKLEARVQIAFGCYDDGSP